MVSTLTPADLANAPMVNGSERGFTALDSVLEYGRNVNARMPERTKHMTQRGHGRGALAISGVAALLASTCCLGPLVLMTLGVSGAWIGNLTALEPYRPWFLAAALIALSLAWRRVFRPEHSCAPGEFCAAPRVRRGYKAFFWIVAMLVIVAIGFPYAMPLFY